MARIGLVTQQLTLQSWSAEHSGGVLIASMSLKSNQLRGKLPTSFGMGLIGMENLELSGNAELVGPIPSTIGAMTRLTFLKLPCNGLTGTIPPTMLKVNCS